MSKVIKDAEKRITQEWGNGGHGGIDLGWRTDEEQNKIYANCKGVVIDCVDGLDNLKGSTGMRSYGNYVFIKHDNGMYSRYAHLKKGTVKVNIGQIVDENTVLGVMGDSGNAYGRHLHFEVYDKASNRINPTPYLTKAIYTETAPSKKSVDEVAREVIAGKWGNGQDRFNRLKNAGYNADEVQKKVNELLSNNKPVNKTYTVKSGDTLSGIASKYRTTWQKLYEKNKATIGNNPNLIKPGQVLKI